MEKGKIQIFAPQLISDNNDSEIKVESIEPRNWWIGMKNNKVMLMLRGHNVAKARVQIKGSGVKILGIHVTDSANYLFADIEILPNAEARVYEVQIVFDGKMVAKTNFELRERRRGSEKRMGIASADAIYLVMPDRFAQGMEQPTTDALRMQEQPNRKQPYGRHGGDIAGIRQHLDYIYSLGMTALWTTPVMETDMKVNSYHGYATTNFYNVDPRLGNIQDYRLLSAALHQRGMKLITDIVLNHCGTEHTWLADSPASDWFNTWDGTPQLTNYRPDVVTDIHASAFDRKRTIEGWFDTTMADLNLCNPLVCKYLSQVAIWWIETADLDGLRVDTYPYVDADAMGKWTNEVLNEYPNLQIIGETWLSEKSSLAMWQKGAIHPSLPAAQLQIPMDFPLQEAITCAFCEDFGWHKGADRLYSAIATDHVYVDPNKMLIFGDNHDTGRLFNRLGNDVCSLHLALTFLATTRGIPQLYYGTEVLLDGDSDFGHAQIRQDMPGGWTNDHTNFFEDMPSEERMTYDFTAQIFALRKKNVALQCGNLIHFLPYTNVYVYFRLHEAQTIMIVLNLCHKKVILDIEHFEEVTGKTLNGVDLLTHRKIKGAKRIAVKARMPMIIEVYNS